MSTTYSIGYGHWRGARNLAEPQEHAALDRLHEGEGTADDMRTLAGIWRRWDDEAMAADVEGMIATPPGGG